MLACPCKICWLCKGNIGYYKSYKENTFKEDERMKTKLDTKCKQLSFEDK